MPFTSVFFSEYGRNNIMLKSQIYGTPPITTKSILFSFYVTIVVMTHFISHSSLTEGTVTVCVPRNSCQVCVPP